MKTCCSCPMIADFDCNTLITSLLQYCDPDALKTPRPTDLNRLTTAIGLVRKNVILTPSGNIPIQLCVEEMTISIYDDALHEITCDALPGTLFLEKREQDQQKLRYALAYGAAYWIAYECGVSCTYRPHFHKSQNGKVSAINPEKPTNIQAFTEAFVLCVLMPKETFLPKAMELLASHEKKAETISSLSTIFEVPMNFVRKRMHSLRLLQPAC